MEHAPDHHCCHDADAFLAEVERECAERGLRLTALRQQVLALLARLGKPVKAYDLLESMREGRGAVAPPTVYRALDFLLEHGFIHKLESINAYVSCHHPAIAHNGPFLICDVCEHAVELEDQGVSRLLEDQAQRLGFQPASQTIEVHGVCSECAGK